MRARRDRSRPTSLRLTQLEDRSVPAVLDVLTPPVFDPHADTGLNTHPLSNFLGGTEFLSGPQSGDPVTLARQALADNAAALNLSAADVAGATVTNAYRSNSGAGLYHTYFRQSFNGLDVYNTSVGVHLTNDGRVITVNGGFVPGIGASSTGVVPVPVVGAADAVAAAASYFGIPLTSAPVLTSSVKTIDYRSVVTESELSATPINTRLVYVNTPAGVRSAWQFNMDVPAPEYWFDVAVDAETGQVTFFDNWVDNYSATYTALPLPTLDPTAGPRTTSVNPWDVAASPFGWQDTDGFAGAEFTDTRGNNVTAQFDPFNVNPSVFSPPSSSRPDAGLGLVFNYPLNLASGPLASVDASVTQLFYLNNILHDVHYKYGFDEEAGNFQVTNYTGLGLGGDPVIADTLDSSLNPPIYTGNGLNRNNASFATPPDGFSPVMRMFVWEFANPARDSSFASGVVVHEYGHGVSNRLTGGPANTSALTTVQSAGMGEGWSDFWSLMFTQKPSGGKFDAYADNNWLMNQPSTGPGDRRFPYSFDMSINPLTFNDYNLDRSDNGEPEVHQTGEIWASALWDMNWLLIDKYGFDKDLSTGYDGTVNGPASAGNKLALQLVMDGLKLQPVNPTFTQARDAILAADVALTGGANQREIWTAFARRGLGTGAFTNSSSDITITTSTAVPTAASRPAVVGVSPAAKTIGGAAPASIMFTFSEQMNTASFNPTTDVLTFTGPNGVDLSGAITSFSWDAATGTMLTINFTPPAGNLAQGNYQLRLAPSIVSADLQASQLDQNFNGVAGEVGDQFVANFRYDAAALTAVLTSVPSATDPNVPAAVIAVFNEPIDVASVDALDLQVSQGTVVSATPLYSIPNDTNSPVLAVRFDLAGVTAPPLYVTLKYGAVTDPYGFPVEEANAKFGKVELQADPFPTPLTPFGALGWEAFSGQVTGSLIDFGQVDSYFLNVDAGQSLVFVADQLTSLRAQVLLFDPEGNLIGLSTGAQSGDPVSVGPVSAPAPGRYVVQITGPSNSTGPYRLRAITGVVVEDETTTPSNINDSLFAPENVDGKIATQGGPGSTLRAATIVGNVGQIRPGGGPFGVGNDTNDYYTFTATAGQRTTIGLARPSGGATLTMTVRNPTLGNVPLDPAPTNFDASATFTPTVTGLYTVQISTTATNALGTDYALALALNGVMDREANNTLATSQPMGTLNGNVRGGLTTSDEDWYTFTLTGVTDVFLTSLTPGDGNFEPENFLDPTIELYDALGTPVGTQGPAADNGAGDGKNALVVAEDLPAGVYRFRVLPSPLGTLRTSGEYIVQLSTTANPAPLNLSTGGPYTLVEGASLPLTATATDPNGDVLSYSWDLNGDGTFGDVTGRTPTVTWAEFIALGMGDGPTTYSIQVQVDDGTNPVVTSFPSSLTVSNANPLAAMYVGATGTVTAQTVPEGSTGVVVRLTSDTNPNAAPTDPSPLDVAIGLRYSFDMDGDGDFDATDLALGGGDGTYAGSLTTPTVTLPAALFRDGPSAVTVSGKVIDKDNGSTIVSVTFTVQNENPSLTASSLTGTLFERTTGRITLAGFTDASAVDLASLRFAFDLNNNGLFDDGAGDGTYAGSLTTPFADVPGALIPNGPGTVSFGVRVIDKDLGHSPDTVFTVPVLNAPPTAVVTLQATSPVQASPLIVTENTDVTVQVTSVTDPADPAPFTYQYDFNYTGTFAADLVSNLPSAVIPKPGNLDDGDAARVVAVRVVDTDGGFSEYLVPVTVQNVAPTATLIADPVSIGSATIATLANGSDVSPVDQNAGFLYSFDFNGDGDFTDPGDVLNSTASSASFTFGTPGTKTINGRITDKDGASTVYQLTTVQVQNVQPTATLTVPPSVVEGAAATITVVGTHPSAAVAAAGFSFDIDFNGDGVFDQTIPRNASAPVSSITVPIPAVYLADGPRPLSVRVRVTESFNSLTGEDVEPVQVTNANPTVANFTGPTADLRVSDPATFTLVGATDASPVDAASLRFSFDLNNDGDFTDAGEVTDSASPTVTTTFRTGGAKVVRGRVSDKDGGFTDYFVGATVIGAVKGGFAAGTDAGNAGQVQLYDATGQPKFKVSPFDPGYTAGVRVAVADVTGDGVPDVVAGSGPGVPAEVRVIDGTNGQVVFSGRPFEKFDGGIFVAAGDMDGDGKAEFVVSPDQGGGARVIVYRGLDFLQTVSFFGINDPAFRGGARVGMADLNGDGRSDLLVSAGFMGGPRVAGFEGSGLLTGRTTKLFNDFFAFEETLRNGVFITGGDVNGDGFADLVVGAGPGGAPRVTVFDGASLLSNKVTQVASFFTGNNESRGGVRVAVADIDADGLADVVTGEADGPRVNLFLGKSVKTGLAGDDLELTPFSTPMNGVFVG